MPLYIIERTFAEQLELTSDDVKLIEEINGDEGVRWLFSFLSADRRRSYCLYEAPLRGRTFSPQPAAQTFRPTRSLRSNSRRSARPGSPERLGGRGSSSKLQQVA